jgi:hypothetical protein
LFCASPSSAAEEVRELWEIGTNCAGQNRQGWCLRIQAVVLHLAEEDRWRNMETLAEPRDVVALQSTLAGKNQ